MYSYTNNRSNCTANITKKVQPQFTYLCIGNSIDWHQPQTDPTFLFQTMFSFFLQAQQTFFFFVLFQQLALPLVMLQRNNQTFIVGVVVIKQRNNSINKKEQTRVISTTALQWSKPSFHIMAGSTVVQ